MERAWYHIPVKEAMQALGTSAEGLGPEEVEKRQQQYGLNKIYSVLSRYPAAGAYPVSRMDQVIAHCGHHLVVMEIFKWIRGKAPLSGAVPQPVTARRQSAKASQPTPF